MHESIYKFEYGTPKQVIDLTKDIPLLCEYIDEYSDGLNQTVITGNSTSKFAFYFEQLKYFAILNPTFDYGRHLSGKYLDLLSYFYSEEFGK